MSPTGHCWIRYVGELVYWPVCVVFYDRAFEEVLGYGQFMEALELLGCGRFASHHGPLHTPAPSPQASRGPARCARPPAHRPQQPLLRVNLLLVLYRELFILPQWLLMVDEEEHGVSDPQPVGHMQLRMWKQPGINYKIAPAL